MSEHQQCQSVGPDGVRCAAYDGHISYHYGEWRSTGEGVERCIWDNPGRVRFEQASNPLLTRAEADARLTDEVVIDAYAAALARPNPVFTDANLRAEALRQRVLDALFPPTPTEPEP